MRIVPAALLLIFPFLLASSLGEFQSAPAGGKRDRDYDRLVGPVRIVRTELEERSSSGRTKGQVTRWLQELSVYDDSGRLTERLTFWRQVIGAITFNFTLLRAR